MQNQKAPISVTVDGQAYDIAPYMTSYGMELQQDLLTTVGAPAMAIILAMQGPSEETPDVKPGDAAQLILSLTKGMPQGQIDKLFKRILEGTIIANTSTCVAHNPTYDAHFQRRYLHLYKLVWATLEAQFGDFFGGVGGIQKLADKLKAFTK